MAEKISKQTVIEDGSEIEGVVVSLCGIAVNGKLKGDVTAPTLTVEASGSVDGRVRVETLISLGELSGEIEAERIELSGKVGDRTILRANELEVKLGQVDGRPQVTFGNCELQVGSRTPAKPVQKGAAPTGQHVPVPVHAAPAGGNKKG